MYIEIKLSERDAVLKKYGFYFVEAYSDRGVWRHKDKEDIDTLYLITKIEGNSCNFIEIFNYDANPLTAFDTVWDDYSVFVAFDSLSELDVFLKILVNSCR